MTNLRTMDVTPHVAQNDAPTKTGKRRRSSIDKRTTRHDGYAQSQTRRKMIECPFGWGKQRGTMRKTKHRGIAGATADFILAPLPVLTNTVASRRDRSVRQSCRIRYAVCQ